MKMEKTKKSRSEVKCVIVGDGGVGKTSMLMSYTAGGIMMDYIPTCFDYYTVDMRVQDRSYSMTLIDTPVRYHVVHVTVTSIPVIVPFLASFCQVFAISRMCHLLETYDRLRTLTYYDTDVFIVCFSVADADSFENVKSKWIPELKQYRPDTPFIIVGTQSDKREPLADDTLNSSTWSGNSSQISPGCVSRRKAKSLAKKLSAEFYSECSALRGEGVADIFSSALHTAVRTSSKKKRSPLKSFKSLFHFKSKIIQRSTND